MRFASSLLAFVLTSACATPATDRPLEAPSAPAYDAAALERLRARAEAERSAALLVWVDGELIVDELYGRDPKEPLFAMSVSKSVVALRIGQLVEAGHLELDAPLSNAVMPEWSGTDKESITLRHLLAHTSGLDPERYAEDPAGFREGSIEAHASTIEMVAEPGEQFAYNNAAVDLLAVVAQRADPEQLYLDDQLQAHLFGPMGIAGAFWQKDAHGQPRAAGELLIRPHDLLALGRLVLERGTYDGERLVSQAWIDTILTPGPYPGCGLLWWLDRREGQEDVASYVADGYLGQYIVVVPEARAVAVRMRDGGSTSWDPAEFSYREFRQDVLAVFPAG